ncbi:HNH endonuclease signature motif containing protein [Microbacterium indicum]|uniref:HNH endonuclease signature motif containing protein n=1 Tax=Microbacterium indicum TaxID=358100 RepID=UPI0003FFFAB2|nr:HNH endonuclease signature motif containing protein [Microbacterium indicum]
MTNPAPPPTSWDMTPFERERADEALAALRAADEMRAGADSLAASAHAVLQAIARAQSKRSGASGDEQDLPYRSMAEEVASSSRVSRTVAERQLADADALTSMYPATQQALRAGRISLEHARAIVSEGQALTTDEARSRFERLCLENAVDATAPRTRRAAKTLVDRLEPRDVEHLHELSRAKRRVVLRDLDHGMSELCAVGESTAIHGVFDRLTTMGRSVAAAHRAEHRRERGEEAGRAEEADPSRRTLDQIRADLLLDIMLTGAPNAHQQHTPGDTALGEIRATVQVIIPVDRLTDVDAGTPGGAAREMGRALLENEQPISTAAAKRVAGTAPTWDRIFVAPDGQVTATDSYRPRREQRRFLLARDGTCRFPGCEAKARSCDIDHTHDYALGGATSLDNLGCLCAAHHVVKHATPWRVRQLARGVYEWTSPLGAKRTTVPASRVRFRDLSADGGPPAEPAPRTRAPAPF